MADLTQDMMSNQGGNNGKMVMDPSVVGLEINRCTIASAKGQIDFKNAVVEFNYYEDIFTNFVSGTLLLNDSAGRHNQMSWTGDEFLQLSIDKPNRPVNGGQEPLHGVFRIYNLKGRHHTKDDNENLLIHFCSEELFLSERMKLSKSYKGKKIHEIVIDICLNVLKIPKEELGYKETTEANGNKKVEYTHVEKTLGTRHLIIPNLKPLEAINWLCTQAISEELPEPLKSGATYLFYRNKDGYFFRTWLGIFKDIKSNQYSTPMAKPSSGYWYGIKNIDYTKNYETNENKAAGKDGLRWDPYEQIISFELNNSFDTNEAAQRGIFSNKLLALDHLRRTHEDAIYDYDKYFKEYLNKNIELYKDDYFNNKPIMSNAQDRFKNEHNKYPDSRIKIYPSSTNQPKNPYISSRQKDIDANFVEHSIPYRYAQIPLLNFNRIKILIPGDPYISIGKIVFVHMPQTAKTPDGKKKNDRFFTGFYLVSCVRHKVDQENNYETVLELIKDSYHGESSRYDEETGLAPFSNDAEWQKYREKNRFPIGSSTNESQKSD